MEIVNLYIDKIQSGCNHDIHEPCYINIQDGKNLNEFLDKCQKGSKQIKNRISATEIKFVIENIKIDINTAVKLVITKSNIGKEPYYYTHLLFLIKKHNNWIVYSYLRAQYAKEKLPPVNKQAPLGYAIYSHQNPDQPLNSNSIKVTHLKMLTTLTKGKLND